MVRPATIADLDAIVTIYNQGIEDRVATLEQHPKTLHDIQRWFTAREDRYAVLVAEEAARVVGWASLNPYSDRCAYAGVAELSVYVHRAWRGRGVGKTLLSSLEEVARQHRFHKIVLFTFPFNAAGQALYRKMGYREVGIFRNQGRLDGVFVDVMAMEKLL
jgi:L-amino acid N-acyltransferase YncA